MAKSVESMHNLQPSQICRTNLPDQSFSNPPEEDTAHSKYDESEEYEHLGKNKNNIVAHFSSFFMYLIVYGVLVLALTLIDVTLTP